MRPMFRPEPALPVGAMQTYVIDRPLETHWRPASCAEVDCAPHRNGWRTVVDERTDLGQAQAYYIRRQSGRGYREERNEAGATVFTFSPGQTCFKADQHRLPLGRPEIYLVRGGDWRGSTGLIRRHTRAADWVDDFAEHQNRIATAHNRG